MTFHLSPEFESAVRAAAAHFKQRDIFIEKDYWVTFVLKALSQSEFRDKVIFKGGTSLSKAFNCIDRFSEDIDLAILNSDGLSDNQLKKLIKQVEGRITGDLSYFEHPNEEKRGRNRRTFYNYQKTIADDDGTSPVKSQIQLEINCFTNPVPFEKKQLNSYLSQFLALRGEDQLIEEFQLDRFSVNVLRRERTFFEKLMSLVRLSYEGPEKLREKIRHFYDLHKLLQLDDLRGQLLIAENHELITQVLNDDYVNSTFAGAWIEKPMAESPLLGSINEIWSALEETYQSELSRLVWSTEALPTSDQIVAMLEEISAFMESYSFKPSKA